MHREQWGFLAQARVLGRGRERQPARAAPGRLLTFSLCRALFSSPSTCRSFLATPMQGRSVRTPRWQATPKPAGAEEGAVEGRHGD